MPETEQLELRTDSVEQLVDLLEIQNAANIGEVMFRDRRRAVADRLKRQISKPDAVAFCGLPGAGKSYTAEKTADVYDAPVVSMGDAIRHKWNTVHKDFEPSSKELGNFAAEWREDDPEGIPETVTHIVDQKFQGTRGGSEQDLFIIDGVRSVADYEVLNDYFDEFYLIEVEAEFYTRLSRLQERGREEETDFTAVDLAERDEREREKLGFRELCEQDHPDQTIKNGTGPDQLAITLSRVVTDKLPVELADGRPLGLNDELESKRRQMAAKPGGPVGE
jgi:dephospho-CoA kinase